MENPKEIKNMTGKNYDEAFSRFKDHMRSMDSFKDMDDDQLLIIFDASIQLFGF